MPGWSEALQRPLRNATELLLRRENAARELYGRQSSGEMRPGAQNASIAVSKDFIQPDVAARTLAIAQIAFTKNGEQKSDDKS